MFLWWFLPMDGLVYLGMPIEGFEPFTINPFWQKYPSSSSGSPPIRALFACRGGLSPGPERRLTHLREPQLLPCIERCLGRWCSYQLLQHAGESSSEQFSKCLWLWLEVEAGQATHWLMSPGMGRLVIHNSWTLMATYLTKQVSLFDIKK